MNQTHSKASGSPGATRQEPLLTADQAEAAARASAATLLRAWLIQLSNAGITSQGRPRQTVSKTCGGSSGMSIVDSALALRTARSWPDGSRLTPTVEKWSHPDIAKVKSTRPSKTFALRLTPKTTSTCTSPLLYRWSLTFPRLPDESTTNWRKRFLQNLYRAPKSKSSTKRR